LPGSKLRKRICVKKFLFLIIINNLFIFFCIFSWMFSCMMDRTDINFFFSFIYFVDYQEGKNIYLCFSEFFIAFAAIGFRMKKYFFYFISDCFKKTLTQSLLPVFIPFVSLVIILFCERVKPASIIHYFLVFLLLYARLAPASISSSVIPFTPPLSICEKRLFISAT